LIPFIADLCFIDIQEGTSIRRLSASVDDAFAGGDVGLEMETYEPEESSAKVAPDGGRGMLIESVPPRARDRILSRLRPHGDPEPPRIRSMIVVPLTARGHSIGTMTLITTSSGRTYQAQDLEFARELARGAALAVDNARLYREAHLAIRRREEVLAMVSHDLRNPVGTIFTSASLLLEMQLPPEAHQRQLQIIRRTARAMDRLIQDLLDASSLESGRFSIDTRPESARALALEATELHANIASARGIELSHDLDGGDLRVQVDHDRVLQVFSNLIGNALKFTPAGGTVTIGCDRAGAMVRFSVRDTGPGIDPDNVPHIFDRFWKGGEGGGSGLGLFIAKGIVEAHSGRIWAETGHGGSTFAFTLPVAEE
jgi:signal transduction histidine kinase